MVGANDAINGFDLFTFRFMSTSNWRLIERANASPSIQDYQVGANLLHVNDIEAQDKKARISWRWWARYNRFRLCYEFKSSGRCPSLLNHTTDARIRIFIDECLQNTAGSVHIKDRVGISTRDSSVSIFINAFS